MAVAQGRAPILATSGLREISAGANAATVGVLSPSNRDFVSGAIGDELISPRLKASVDSPKNGDSPRPNATKREAPGRSPANKSPGQNANFYREARNAVGHGALFAPSYLFVRDVRGGFQLRAIGAPIAPIAGENPADRSQAQFPVFSLAW